MTQPDLPRRRPDTIVAIHPVPEYSADAALRARYEEMKSAFRVPWMGVVAMAHAHYRSFYDCLWQGLREIALSSLFARHCRELRAETEAAAAALPATSLVGQLGDRGYAPREIEEIRETIEVFSAGNYPYLLLASVSRLLLAGGSLAGSGPLEPDQAPALPSGRPVLMEAHHASAETRALFERIKQRLDLPFVNTDYRALARWPSYFELAWAGLEGVLRSPAHEAACSALHRRAVEIAIGLPNPASLRADALRAAAQNDADPAEVAAMAELFQWLLPELCVNVAYFRFQLAG